MSRGGEDAARRRNIWVMLHRRKKLYCVCCGAWSETSKRSTLKGLTDYRALTLSPVSQLHLDLMQSHNPGFDTPPPSPSIVFWVRAPWFHLFNLWELVMQTFILWRSSDKFLEVLHTTDQIVLSDQVFRNLEINCKNTRSSREFSPVLEGLVKESGPVGKRQPPHIYSIVKLTSSPVGGPRHCGNEIWKRRLWPERKLCQGIGSGGGGSAEEGPLWFALPRKRRSTSGSSGRARRGLLLKSAWSLSAWQSCRTSRCMQGNFSLAGGGRWRGTVRASQSRLGVNTWLHRWRADWFMHCFKVSFFITGTAAVRDGKSTDYIFEFVNIYFCYGTSIGLNWCHRCGFLS